MVLKSKGFFLNLEAGASTDQVLQIAPVRDLPAEDDQEVSLDPIPAITKMVDGRGIVQPAKPAQAVAKPVKATKPTASASTASASTASVTAPAPSAPAAAKGSMTTAEEIAAALAEAEAARPVVTLSTFAPEMIRPGRALRLERRRPGRNLKGFRDMASELFSS